MPLRFIASVASLAPLAPLALSTSKTQETEYSTNAICRQNNCINPVFPGLSDLEQLEAFQWQCTSSSDVRSYLTFCKDAVNYDAAIPSPSSNTTLQSLVQAQDTAAVTAYFYHLSGMNLEANKNRHPEDSDNDCIRETWKLICHTYFPKAEAGCTPGTASTYMRPCKNACESYVDACQVHCCDESARCVFEANVMLADGSLKTETAYVDQEGPSATCTGAATRSAGGAGVSLLTALLSSVVLPGSVDSLPTLRSVGVVSSLAVVATMLQGCDFLDAMGHSTANWEDKPSYYTNFQYIPPGKDESQAVLNSCSVTGLDPALQCNGNGVCRAFNTSGASAVVDFCECYRDWADPECRTKRKSQYKAFMLSLFGGIFGLDRFYLGEYYSAFGKISTLGGLGLWWIWDLVRIGSAPVYAADYRLAADLPHSLYVFMVCVVFSVLGWLVFSYYGANVAKKKRMKNMLLEAEDEFFRTRSATVEINAMDKVGQPGKSSYGTLVPVWDINRKIMQQARQMEQLSAPFPGQAGAGVPPGGLGAGSVPAGASYAASLQRSASHASGAAGAATMSMAAPGRAAAAAGATATGPAAGADNAAEAALRARMAAQAAAPSKAMAPGGPQPMGAALQPQAQRPGAYPPASASMQSGGQPGGALGPFGNAPAGQFASPQPGPSAFGAQGVPGGAGMAPAAGGPAGAPAWTAMPGMGSYPGGLPPGSASSLYYPVGQDGMAGVRPAPLGANIKVV